jgi:hypothetical protein
MIDVQCKKDQHRDIAFRAALLSNNRARCMELHEVFIPRHCEEPELRSNPEPQEKEWIASLRSQ